ncbi:MAG: FkbM family methyltransferase [Holosporales bacterium]
MSLAKKAFHGRSTQKISLAVKNFLGLSRIFRASDDSQNQNLPTSSQQFEKFITYSQNFEDLMLYRALKEVKNGFYIDLGAAGPVLNSVTKAFYDRGWSGINVEPGHRPYTELMKERTRDININVGAWSSTGKIKFYFIGDENELSTTNTYLMEIHKANGWPVREEEISVMSLRDICEKHVENREIHFLKVDVEGAELEVFKGHDFERWRPWIIVVESHESERKSEHWKPTEAFLLNADYTFVYCDGLNRFYIENSRYNKLKDAFEVPPNIYDNWVQIEYLNLQYREGKAKQDLEEFKKMQNQRV